MSNQTNDIIAENLFQRLETLEAVVNERQYVEMQQDLLGLLSTGAFEEASEAVIKWEQDYSGLLIDLQTDDRLEALSGDVF